MISISPARIALSLVAAVTVSLSMLSPQVVARADAPVAQSTATVTSIDTRVRYRTVEIDGITLFYREAGPADAPVVVLLHGFPASSFMYRDLIELLAGRFHVIAPDYPGFGYSGAPPVQAFSYTFDHLADIIEKFTDRLGSGQIRPLHAGLWRAGGLPACEPASGESVLPHRPECQRLRRRIARQLLEAGPNIVARPVADQLRQNT